MTEYFNELLGKPKGAHVQFYLVAKNDAAGKRLIYCDFEILTTRGPDQANVQFLKDMQHVATLARLENEIFYITEDDKMFKVKTIYQVDVRKANRMAQLFREYEDIETDKRHSLFEGLDLSYVVAMKWKQKQILNAFENEFNDDSNLSFSQLFLKNNHA